MKTIMSILLVMVLFIGTGMSCSSLKKGDSSANNFRLFWTTEGFEFNSTSNSTYIKLQKSNTDADTLKAVAEGVAAGAVKGATGKP